MPWPHMPRYPTLLKKMTPAAHDGILRRDEQRADDDVRAARLVDDRRAEPVELASEPLAALRERAAAEIGAAGDDHAGRLAAGVRIDDFDALRCHVVRR